MIRLFINGLSGSAGGGLTYLRNAIPQFAAVPEVQVTVALPTGIGHEFRAFTNVDVLEMQMSVARRFWFEEFRLSELLQQTHADVLLSAGNFALRKSPVPQILLSRNSIYTSADFSRDLLSRREYRMWLDTRVRGVLAKQSIRWADVTIAPTEAFASELRCWTGVQVRAIHHGFDRDAFTRNSGPLPEHVAEKIESAQGSLKLIFVSHYNYYRNLETLLRALPLLRKRLEGRSVRLFLTCRLRAGENPGAYNPESAQRLIKNLGVSGMVVELGAVPYDQVHRLYSCADVYVTPAYTETFAHPLVEAMSTGIPVIASDIAVHREICEDAARYFPPFSPELLTERIVEVATSPETARQIAAAGLARAQHFSWKRHVASIVGIAAELTKSANPALTARSESTKIEIVA
jgi:glycosyltransferase involved in cell wall biosynthesis